MVCLHEDQHCAQVEVTEPEAYQFDGEYERKAAELDQPDLISIRQSTVRLCLPTPAHALPDSLSAGIPAKTPCPLLTECRRPLWSSLMIASIATQALRVTVCI